VFSENLQLAADLFQGELPCKDRASMYANPMLLLGRQESLLVWPSLLHVLVVKQIGVIGRNFKAEEASGVGGNLH